MQRRRVLRHESIARPRSDRFQTLEHALIGIAAMLFLEKSTLPAGVSKSSFAAEVECQQGTGLPAVIDRRAGQTELSRQRFAIEHVGTLQDLQLAVLGALKGALECRVQGRSTACLERPGFACQLPGAHGL